MSDSDAIVLVVEDEVRLREGLLRAIPAMGFAAVGASTAEQGIALFERSPMPVVILDLRLPGAHGMTFLEKIRERWPTTQVIIQTGYGDFESARRAVHLDAVEFLTKPCALAELEKAIDRAWRRWRELAASVQAGAHKRKASSRDEHEDPVQETSLEQIERRSIMTALERHGHNRTAAAGELGISRRKLQYRIKEYKRQGLL